MENHFSFCLYLICTEVLRYNHFPYTLEWKGILDITPDIQNFLTSQTIKALDKQNADMLLDMKAKINGTISFEEWPFFFFFAESADQNQKYCLFLCTQNQMERLAINKYWSPPRVNLNPITRS